MRIYPIFLGNAGCPQKCVYCNQAAAEVVRPWKESLAEALSYLEESQLTYDEVALYGGTPTASEYLLRELLEPFRPFLDSGKIGGIRLSTRPDAITEESVQLMTMGGVTTVELGVESFSDHVLAESQRGYSVEQVLKAYELLKGRFKVVFQIMFGLPGESDSDRQLNIDETLRLKPWAVRLFPTLVLKGTSLEAMHKQGKYTPMSVEDAIHWCRKAYNAFVAEGIRVIQIGLHSSEFLSSEFVAGPYAGNFGEMVRGRPHGNA
ncbi:radical SAM protein [Coprothermobacteraceae bacterium]|nr:radical SAM protein [Coprothermobacteraceae bacterium]